MLSNPSKLPADTLQSEASRSEAPPSDVSRADMPGAEVSQADASHRDLDTFCLVLQRAARLWRREANEALRAYNLSEATTTPLWLISRMGDGLRQRTLADHLGIEGQSLVRLLDQLEAAGLVMRRDDPTDRRAKTLHLTQSGRAVVAQVNNVVKDVRVGLLNGVSEKELETTARVLDSVISSAEHHVPSKDT